MSAGGSATSVDSNMVVANNMYYGSCERFTVVTSWGACDLSGEVFGEWRCRLQWDPRRQGAGSGKKVVCPREQQSLGWTWDSRHGVHCGPHPYVGSTSFVHTIPWSK